MDNILEMKGIRKSFPGVQALKGIDFSLRTGEVHALMGENGAGKSTLIKILTGVYQMDEGKIIYDGREVSIKTTAEAQQLGISTVYQELNMIPYLSVAENIYVGRYPMKGRRVDWKKVYTDVQKLLDDMDLKIDAKAMLNTYGTAAQQMVSIARAISMNSRVIVLDEPTSSLDTDEVQLLFGMVRDLKKRGIAVIFITHRLDEVYQICDRITVLKDGEYQGTWNVEDLNQQQLITTMVGREIENQEKIPREHSASDDQVMIELDHILSRPKLKDISLTIRKGEIVGLAGLLGSGRTETAQVIFGYTVPDEGDIRVKGEKVRLKSPRDGVMRGMAFCTENRREEGIVPNMSVRDNILLSSLRSVSDHGFLNRRRGEKIVQEYIERFHIKTPGSGQKIKNLSGGNQQKVILARWLATNPDFIIFDEPTRGIDVGAKRDVEELVAKIADMGLAVLLISSEMSELVRNCDRVYALRDGQIVGEVEGDDIREDKITAIIAEGRR